MIEEGYLYEEVTFRDYEFVNKIDGEIRAGELYESQFLFVIQESLEYILTHQSYLSDTEWFFK